MPTSVDRSQRSAFRHTQLSWSVVTKCFRVVEPTLFFGKKLRRFVRLKLLAGMGFKRIAFVLAAALCLCACKSEDENLIPTQTTQIEQFLNANDLEYEALGGVYRHFRSRGEENAPVIQTGDRVEFMYEIYKASYTKLTESVLPDQTTALASNKPEVLEALAEIGLNIKHWTTEPYITRLGSEELIAGLNKGLAGCKTGDEVWFFMTSDMALGEAALGPVPMNTPLVYMIDIVNVTK